MKITTEKFNEFFNSYILSDDKTRFNSTLALLDVLGMDDDKYEKLFESNIPEIFLENMKILKSINGIPLPKRSKKLVLELFPHIDKYDLIIENDGFISANYDYVINLSE